MFIGLTGKSAGGKNFVSEYMEKIGWKVLDLDKMCHELYEVKKDELVSQFGSSDRQKIGKIVFENLKKLRELEAVLYPALKELIMSNADDSSVIVINGALLHRANLDSLCRYVVYVDASYETRLKRAVERDAISENEFSKRDRAQSDVDFRNVKYRCEVIVIDNEKDCSVLLKEICNRINGTFQMERAERC